MQSLKWFVRLPYGLVCNLLCLKSRIRIWNVELWPFFNLYSFELQVMIFFSAHGVPASYVEDAGDPYKAQMEDCVYLIMQELKSRGIGNDHTLAYQVGFRTKFRLSLVK